MRVEGNYDVFAVFQVLAHILHLICVYVRHGELHRYGEIDYDLVLGSGLPHVKYRIAYLQCEFGLCSREAFGGVLKSVIPLIFFAVLLAEPCAADGYIQYLLPALAEYLFALSQGSGIIEMHYGILAAPEGFKGLFYDMLSRLCEYLYGNVVGYELLLYESAAEVVFRFGGCGEAYLDLLEADIHQLLEEFQLLPEAHGSDKRLIPVAEINAAPLRSFVDIGPFRPFH